MEIQMTATVMMKIRKYTGAISTGEIDNTGDGLIDGIDPEATEATEDCQPPNRTEQNRVEAREENRGRTGEKKVQETES